MPETATYLNDRAVKYCRFQGRPEDQFQPHKAALRQHQPASPSGDIWLRHQLLYLFFGLPA